MADQNDQKGLNQTKYSNATSMIGRAAFISSCIAVIVLSLALTLALIQSCSAANIAIFMILLSLSALLVFIGTILGGLSYRRSKNRMALISLLFTVLYTALLIYLLQLIYS